MTKRKKKEEDASSDDVFDAPGLLLGQVCRRLGCTKAKVRKFVEDGSLSCFEADGFTYYPEDEIDELYELGFADSKRDVAFDQTIKALKNSTEHINKFVAITIDPVMRSNDALLAENKNLRDQNARLYEEIREVNELYSTLQRQTLELEIEAKKETLNIEQRHEAFTMLREQIVPAIVDNMGAKKLLETLDDEKIEVLIESGILTGEQEKTLKNYFFTRQATRQRKEAAAAKKNGEVTEKQEQEKP